MSYNQPRKQTSFPTLKPVKPKRVSVNCASFKGKAYPKLVVNDVFHRGNGKTKLGDILVEMLVRDPGVKYSTIDSHATRIVREHIRKNKLPIRRLAKVDGPPNVYVDENGMETGSAKSPYFIRTVVYEIRA